MPEYAVIPSKRFEDDFRILPKDVQRQVLSAINRIKADPHRGQKLRGVEVGVWRYRVGNWRIRYDVEGTRISLHVVRHRKDVYR